MSRRQRRPHRLAVWRRDHLQAARLSLGRLGKRLAGSLLQLLGIALALALPATLLLLADDLGRLGGDLDRGGLTAYIPDATAGQALAAELAGRTDVASVEWLPPAAAREQLAAATGLGELLSALPENPLPGVLGVRLVETGDPIAAAQTLATWLRQHPGVDQVQVDLAWMQRLQALFEVLRSGAWLLGLGLGGAVAIGIANTLRAEIGEHREEIRLTKLLGGSDAYVRRPYLYTGLIYGLGGGVLAWLLSALALAQIGPPLETLINGLNLTGQPLVIAPPGLPTLLGLLGLASALALLTAWLTAHREVLAIEPE